MGAKAAEPQAWTAASATHCVRSRCQAKCHRRAAGQRKPQKPGYRNHPQEGLRDHGEYVNGDLAVGLALHWNGQTWQQ
jgi:hypothetical protein